MHSVVCVHCKEANRVSKPILVSYMSSAAGGRRSERHSFWACSWCDAADSWANFTKQSPPLEPLR